MVDDTLSEDENLEVVAEERVELLIQLGVPQGLNELADSPLRLQ